VVTPGPGNEAAGRESEEAHQKTKTNKAVKRMLTRRKKRAAKKMKKIEASSSTAKNEPVGIMDLRQEVGVYTLSAEEQALLARGYRRG
jgi:hypothetical protein